jgi:ABC-2 type transport system permease protein
MSWIVVAKKDFRDALRSRWLLGLTVLFVALISGVAALLGWAAENAPGLVLAIGGFDLLFTDFVVETDSGTNVIVNSSFVVWILNRKVVTWFLPLIAVIMAHNAIIDERESGSLKLLLSLPHSRPDVVFGKMLGRTAAIVGPQFAGFVLPGIILALLVPFQAVEYFGFMLMTGLLTMVFVSISVGLSATLATRQRVLIASIAFYMLFVSVWGTLKLPFGNWASRQNPGTQNWPDALSWMPIAPSDFVDVLELINPTGAFKALSGPFLEGNLFAPGADPNRQFAALMMLVFWLFLPMLVGIWRFDSVDL